MQSTPFKENYFHICLYLEVEWFELPLSPIEETATMSNTTLCKIIFSTRCQEIMQRWCEKVQHAHKKYAQTPDYGTEPERETEMDGSDKPTRTSWLAGLRQYHIWKFGEFTAFTLVQECGPAAL